MSRSELSHLSGSQILVRYGNRDIRASLHASHRKTAYITFVVDELRHLYVLTDHEVHNLSFDSATVFDLDGGKFGAKPVAAIPNANPFQRDAEINTVAARAPQSLISAQSAVA